MTESLQEKTKDPYLKYYAPARVDTLVVVIVTFIIFVVLVRPVVVTRKLLDIRKHASAFESIGNHHIHPHLWHGDVHLNHSSKAGAILGLRSLVCGLGGVH